MSTSDSANTDITSGYVVSAVVGLLLLGALVLIAKLIPHAPSGNLKESTAPTTTGAATKDPAFTDPAMRSSTP